MSASDNKGLEWEKLADVEASSSDIKVSNPTRLPIRRQVSEDIDSRFDRTFSWLDGSVATEDDWLGQDAGESDYWQRHYETLAHEWNAIFNVVQKCGLELASKINPTTALPVWSWSWQGQRVGGFDTMAAAFEDALRYYTKSDL